VKAAAAPLFQGLAWFGVLYLLYGVSPGPAMWFIEDATVRPAVWLLGLVAPDWQPQAAGARLLVEGGALHVLPGCEGADLALLSASAMLAAPLAWRWRLLGLTVMLMAVFVLNQLRLLLLLLVHLREPAWFDPLHTLWLPLAMVMLLGSLLLAWTARFDKP
jgi:exosortase/archaeosortase family protein